AAVALHAHHDRDGDALREGGRHHPGRKSMKHERTIAYVAFATVCLVWGTTYLFIRIAVETIPPVLLTGARFSVAGVILLALAYARGERIPRDRSTLLNVALVGLLLIAVGNLSVVWAEQWVPS